MMHDHSISDDAAASEPISQALRRISAGITETAADQIRPGSPYLKNPPLTSREREWADRARLVQRLLKVLLDSDGEDLLSPSLDRALIAVNAIVDDAARAVSPRA